MMEAAKTSETAVKFYQSAWLYNLKNIHLHITVKASYTSTNYLYNIIELHNRNDKSLEIQSIAVTGNRNKMMETD
jgi:hypothetical protein